MTATEIWFLSFRHFFSLYLLPYFSLCFFSSLRPSASLRPLRFPSSSHSMPERLPSGYRRRIPDQVRGATEEEPRMALMNTDKEDLNFIDND